MDLDRVADACGFRFDPELVAARNNQQTSIAAGVLERDHHERVDQLLQIDFARHRLRHLHYGGEFQLLDRCPDRSVGLRRRRLLSQMGMCLIKVADLAVGAPAHIAGPCSEGTRQLLLLSRARHRSARRVRWRYLHSE